MAIQNRRGSYGEFRPSAMVAGEIAFVQEGDNKSFDGQSVYVCFQPGVVKRFALYEDMDFNIRQATQTISEELTHDVQSAISDVNQAKADCIEETQKTVTATLNANNAVENTVTAISEFQMESAQVLLDFDTVADVKIKECEDAAEEARSAAQVVKIKTSLTFLESGWSSSAPSSSAPYTIYTINVDNSSLANKGGKDFNVTLDIGSETNPTNVSNMKKSFACIDKIECTSTGIIATCFSKKPTVNFTVLVKEI